jgi:hypothetical protein
VRPFYVHISRQPFDSTNGKTTSLFHNLQFLGKCEILPVELYKHTAKKSVHCIVQCTDEAQHQISVSCPASYRSQRPAQAARSLWAHYEKDSYLSLVQVQHISLVDAIRVSSSLKYRESRQTTSELNLAYDSPKLSDGISGGSELGSSHLRTTNGKRTLTGGIKGVHHFGDAPPFFFYSQKTKKPPLRMAFLFAKGCSWPCRFDQYRNRR